MTTRSAARDLRILIVAFRGECAGNRGACGSTDSEALNDVKNSGNEEDSNGAGGQHAANDGGTHDLTSDGTGAGSGPERHAAQDECKRGHKNGTQAEACAFESGVHERFAFLKFVFRELDDKNGVFRGETDQHDKTDLRVDVTFDLDHVARKERGEQRASEPEDEEGSKDRDGRAEENAEGQRPALVKGGENEKNEEERKSENH